MNSTETPITKTPMGGTDKTVLKERGSNITPKSEMHVGRNWNQASWLQAFNAICKKWDKEAYAKRSELK